MTQPAPVRRIVILGAAGRDFHNFNVAYRADPAARVVAFTAAQIPGIAGPALPGGAGRSRVPAGHSHRGRVGAGGGVPARGRRRGGVRLQRRGARDGDAPGLTRAGVGRGLHPARTQADHAPLPPARGGGVGRAHGLRQVPDLALRGAAAAAVRPAPGRAAPSHALRGPRGGARPALRLARRPGRRPLHERGARGVRAPPGDGQRRLRRRGLRGHPPPGGEGGGRHHLGWRQQRLPFLVPDLHIAVTDALRPRQVDTHHPGEAVIRMADVVVVNKVDAAPEADAQAVMEAVRAINPTAVLVRTASPVTLERPELVRGRRALVVEDGPTLTHGGMGYGAGFVAAAQAGAEIVDPRPAAVGAIAELYVKYPHLGPVLPAVGYDPEQLAALGETMRRAGADVIVSASPIDLGARVQVDVPIVRARYELADIGQPGLGAIVEQFAYSHAPAAQ